MSLFSNPEDHAANGPETWEVKRVEAGSRVYWYVVTKDGTKLYQSDTRREALASLTGGHNFDLWHKERRWYAGEPVSQWKPWAEVKAEREAQAQKKAEREALKAVTPDTQATIWRAPGEWRILTDTAELRISEVEARAIMLAALKYCNITRQQIDAETGKWLGGWAA